MVRCKLDQQLREARFVASGVQSGVSSFSHVPLPPPPSPLSRHTGVAPRECGEMTIEASWATAVSSVDTSEVLTAAECCDVLSDVVDVADVALIFSQLRACTRKWHSEFCKAQGHATLVHALAAAFFRMSPPECVVHRRAAPSLPMVTSARRTTCPPPPPPPSPSLPAVSSVRLHRRAHRSPFRTFRPPFATTEKHGAQWERAPRSEGQGIRGRLPRIVGANRQTRSGCPWGISSN